MQVAISALSPQDHPQWQQRDSLPNLWLLLSQRAETTDVCRNPGALVGSPLPVSSELNLL